MQYLVFARESRFDACSGHLDHTTKPQSRKGSEVFSFAFRTDLGRCRTGLIGNGCGPDGTRIARPIALNFGRFYL